MGKKRSGIVRGEFNELVNMARKEGATHYEALDSGPVAMWGLWRGVYYALLMKAMGGGPDYLLSGWARKSSSMMEPDFQPISELKEPPPSPYE
jgi:hypothetical protein